MKALDSGCSCRDVTLKFRCGKPQISSLQAVSNHCGGCSCSYVVLMFGCGKIIYFQDHEFTAKFTHVCAYAHTFNTFNVSFDLFSFVISAGNKHIHLNSLYNSTVNVC